MTSVSTPSPLPTSSLSNASVHAVWRKAFKDEKCWTKQCTEALQYCPRLLFCYDRLEFACSMAFGGNPMQRDASCSKIMVNPLMMICYHPDCLKKSVITLKHPCNITPYISHLASHTDAVGDSLFKRFKAMNEDMFMDMDEYDAISVSPFHLLQPGPFISHQTQDLMRKYAIIRDLDVFYVFHWKNILLQENYLSTQSLAFQEDDALVNMFLNYPKPVDNWQLWSTISTFSMKLFTSVSGTALSLHRGTTSYPVENLPNKTKKPIEFDRKQFLRDVNHPAPSLSNLQEHFPPVSYENRQYHQTFQSLHLKILSNYNKSLALDFANVKRFPVVLGTDEQELNQGTFIENNVLHGLRDRLDAGKIKTVGLKDLPKFIQKKCPFLSSAREYRLTDLDGAHSSNIYTEFIAGTMSTKDCESSLKEIIRLSNSCENCLMINKPCMLLSIDKRCESCEELNTHCTSMVVFLVLWDMGSSHKKTANQMLCITDDSNDEYDMNDPGLVSIAFGGLHLAKSPTNFLRNNVVTLNGQNYGLHIIRALRNTPGPHSSIISNLKAAVPGAKDRHSDFLSYETTGPLVQDSLKAAKTYKCTRLPEPTLTYKVKSQYKIVCPTGVQCNQNGDVFILDSGASCVHAVERTSVAKVTLLGTYSNPSNKQHNQTAMITGSEVKLSNYLTDIFIPKDADNIYVVDAGRGEVVIVRNCLLSNRIRSAYINIWKKEGIRAISLFNGNIICVTVTDSENLVEIITLDLPSPVNKNSLLHVFGKVKRTVDVSVRVKYVFSISPSVVGFVSEQKELIICSNPGMETSKQKNSGIKTAVKPQIVDGTVRYIQVGSTQLNHLNVTLHTETKEILVSVARYIVLADVPLVTHCFAVWGSTFHLLSNVNGLKLIEYGSLSFGLKYSEDINSFYKAISYTPPHGYVPEQKKTLEDCIKLAKPLVDTLSSMQTECEERFPNLKSFYGIHGAVWTQTLKCFQSSLSSWSAVLNRLNHFDKSLADKVNPHAITNESPLEHSFGFTVTKSPGQLQSQYEYIHNKMKHEVDFQLRLTNVNFCQKVKVKLRDKSYQDLDDEMRTVLTVKDIWDILLSGKSGKKSKRSLVSSSVDPSDERILKQAFLLSKSVPRRSNRAKYKEESGHAPTMYINDEDEGKLLVGDLVFTRNGSGEVKKLIVVKEISLGNIDDTVLVKDELAQQESLPVSHLMKEKGLIFIIPSTLYKFHDKSIEMSEIALQMFQECVDSITDSVYTDEEIAELPRVSQDRLASQGTASQSSMCISDSTHLPKNRKVVAYQSDDDADSDADDHEYIDDVDDDDHVDNLDEDKGDDDDDDEEEAVIATSRKRKRTAEKLLILSDDDSGDDDNNDGDTAIDFDKDKTELMVTTSLIAHKISDLCEGMWVLVHFQCQDTVPDDSNGAYFLGIVMKITSDPAGANVRCLEKQFGLGEPQRLEKCWKWYSVVNIFVSPVIPQAVTLGTASTWTYEYQS